MIDRGERFEHTMALFGETFPNEVVSYQGFDNPNRSHHLDIKIDGQLGQTGVGVYLHKQGYHIATIAVAVNNLITSSDIPDEATMRLFVQENS